MEAIRRLSVHLKNRLVDLNKAKREGRKIIGYTPGGYLPEELVLACDAIPICLIRGGDHSIVEISGRYVCRWLDTFCRAQIGYAVSGDDPYYNIVDLLAIPITDNQVRAVSDIIDYATDIDVFPFGVPHSKDVSSAKYYLSGITRFKQKLEDITGVTITNEKLKNAIDLCNKERLLLKNISLLRKSRHAPLTGKEFIWLNHASHFADKRFMIEILEQLYGDLQDKSAGTNGHPRILLTGSTLAMGDSKIMDLIEETGGTVVVEEFAEGIKPYWENVQENDDLLEALADCYFVRRVPPAWFRPGKERLDFLVNLATDFAVDGVIWYQLLYRDSYKIESFYFPDILKSKTGLSMLVIDSDYDPSETGAMRTRVETFIETIRR
jgi:benzoyl-CoA reductase/2-hydroxyglutaryl-CoA dehydratase subunit BcrC/BadD/HgdB